MNKVIFLLFSLLSEFSLAINKTEIDVAVVSNLQFKTNYKIVVSENSIYFNSEKIDPVQFPILIPSLKVLSRVKSDKATNCYAGTFTHRVIKGKKITQMSGCLNSKRAEQLLIGIERFKKAKIL